MSEPITPTRTYYTVFAALIALTLLTVAVSFLELGAWHTTVGVLIGVVKASLVGLFFMHLLHSLEIIVAGRAGRTVLAGHPHGVDSFGLPDAPSSGVLSQRHRKATFRGTVGVERLKREYLQKCPQFHQSKRALP